MTHQSGRCLCGQVSYTLDGPPLATAVCHCRNCQRQSGSAFSVNLMVRESQLSLAGELATFEDEGGSGNKVHRRFCARCGSPVLSALDAMPGLVAVKAGTLDDVSQVRPGIQIWCDSKQDWLHLSPELPAFAKSPPAN